MMEAIRFADTPKNFAPGKDLKVLYTITKPDVTLGSRDWVGLFKEGWSHTRQYLAFEWAPSEPSDGFEMSRRRKQRRRRSVLFPAADIQVPENEWYQLVYVNRHDEILGRSRTFVIGERPPSPVLPMLVETPELVDKAASDQQLTMQVDSSSSDHSQKSLLKGFEILSGSESSIDGATKEDLVFVEHVDVVSSMEHISHQDNYVEEIEDAINWGSIDSVSTENRERALVHVRSRDLALVKVESKSRALVKFDPDKKALVPYRPREDPLMLIYSAAPQKQEVRVQEQKKPLDMFPVSTRYFDKQPEEQEPPVSTPADPSTRRKVKQPTRCRRCRQIQARLRRATADKEALIRQQEDDRKEQESREAQVGIMSSRIRNLSRENTRLEKQQTTLIEEHKARLQAEQQTAKQEKDRLANLKEQLEFELEEMKKQNTEINEQLDNILYSLSVQGVSGIKETNGKILDLSTISLDPARPPLSAEGWKVARSRKEERLVAGLRDKTNQLSQANQQCAELQQQIDMGQKNVQQINTQLQSEKDTVELLQRKLVQMDGQVYDLKQHVIVLQDMLGKEEKHSRASAEDRERTESALHGQISHLNQLLREAHQLKSTGTGHSPVISRPLPSTRLHTDMDVAEEKPLDLSSPCVDDPAIISASWSARPSPPLYPVPLAGLFSNNPPLNTPTEKPKPKKKKMKLATKTPTYYPVYEPMKFHPGVAVKESDLKPQPRDSDLLPMAIPKKRKLTSSPVEIVDHSCSRCGMMFPKDCPRERLERHRAMHRRVASLK